MLRVQCLRRSCFVVPPRSDGFKVQSSRFKASRSMPVAFKGSMLRVQRFIHKFTQMDTNGHKCTQMNYGVMSRAVVQSCSRAVVQSCSRVVVQSCIRAVVQSSFRGQKIVNRYYSLLLLFFFILTQLTEQPFRHLLTGDI